MRFSIIVLTGLACMCLKAPAQTVLPAQQNQSLPKLMQLREDIIKGKKTTADLDRMSMNNGTLITGARSIPAPGRAVSADKLPAAATNVFHLTKDINALTSSNPYNNNLLNYFDLKYAVMNNIAYFWADDGVHGSELWRSDGTPAGTYLVKDITAGNLSSAGSQIASTGNKLFFAVGTDQLWTSDGTEAGTQFVKTIPFTGGNSLVDFFPVGNSIFFVATTFPSGSIFNQLWKSDGTDAGTVLVYDDGNNNPGWGMSHFTYANGLLYFTNTNSANGYEVWRSDGTTAGTHILRDINPDAYDYYGQGPDNLTVYNNQVYFTESDGTYRKLFVADIAGTTATAAPGNNSVIFDPLNYYLFANNPFTVSNGLMYMQGSTAATGNELFRYDAINGEVLLKDITPGTDNTKIIAYGAMSDVNNVLYFGVVNAANQYELWATRGKTNNTARIKQFNNGESFSAFFNANGTLVFQKSDATYGTELWKSDGTGTGTVLVKDIYAGVYGGNPSFFTLAGNKLLFTAYTAGTGNELWSSNLTDAGTKQVKDINKSSTESSYAGQYYTGITAFGNGALFSASTKETGAELYQSDGSSAGTALLKDNVPGEVGSSPQFFLNKNNYIYFRSSEQTGNTYLNNIYRTDGTAAGTVKIVSAPTASERFTVTDNGFVYYTAYNSLNYTYDLYRSDGTEAGTILLLPGLYYDAFPVAVGNTVFFANSDNSNGTELWKTDGTVAGTTIVKDIYPGANSSAPYSLTVFNGNIYFGAYDGTNSAYSFWRSNGTEAGTIKLSTVTPYTQNVFDNNKHFCVSNNTLYFTASDIVNGNGYELWKTTGTANSTKMVKDIYPGSFGSNPGYLTDVNGTLFFMANDPLYGQELWGSNGTASGTKLIKDVTPGGSTYLNYPPTVAAGRFYFVVFDSLWVSAGTAASTKQVNDAGLSGLQYIQNLTGTPTKLFFGAYTYNNGYELYVGDLTPGAATIASTDDAITLPAFDAKIYPNPVKNVAQVTVSGDAKKLNITVRDINGKVVLQQKFSNTTQLTLQTGKFAAGVYFVTVHNGRESKVIKLVKD